MVVDSSECQRPTRVDDAGINRGARDARDSRHGRVMQEMITGLPIRGGAVMIEIAVRYRGRQCELGG